MKKTTALILSGVMVLGLLAGCQRVAPEDTPGVTEGTAVTETTEATEVTEPVETEPEVKTDTISQGKMIRKLYKLANPSADFEDLEGALAWAGDTGITAAEGFDPETPLTRLDIARYLSRYAEALGLVRDGDKLEDLKGWVWDEAEITGEADREAVAWAIGSGVMQLYRRQLLPTETVSPQAMRQTIARLSSLAKAVQSEANMEATEPTEPEETEAPEDEDGNGSTGGNGGSGNSGSGSGNGSGGSSGGNSGGNTEPPATEPPAEYIDTAALEAYGRQYATSTYGYAGDASIGFGNGAGYFPPAYCVITTMEEGRRHAREAVDYQYSCDIGMGYSVSEIIDGVEVRTRVNVYFQPADEPNAYWVYCFYGGK